jgi:Flp pilus assembly pilin Flp
MRFFPDDKGATVVGREEGQSFVEFALMIILVAIVVLAILLIMGDDIRVFVNQLLQTWFPQR